MFVVDVDTPPQWDDARHRQSRLSVVEALRRGQSLSRYRVRSINCRFCVPLKIILGLRPMTIFDAAAKPLFDAFSNTPPSAR